MSDPDMLQEKKLIVFKYGTEEVSFFLPDREDHIQKTIRREQNFYEQDMLEDILKRVVPGSLALDIGANIGNHTIFFSKICKLKVISFEPFEHCYKILTKNVYLNKINEQVTTHHKAVGCASGTGTPIIVDSNNLGQTRFVVQPSGDVEMVALDDLHFDQRVSLLKIDVEGMELDVLKGGSELIKRDNPLIYIEIAEDDLFVSVKSFLLKLGYWQIGVFNWTPTYLFMPGNDAQQEFSLVMARFDRLQVGAKKMAMKMGRYDEQFAQQNKIIEEQRRAFEKRIDTLSAKVDAQIKQADEHATTLVEKFDTQFLGLCEQAKKVRESISRLEGKIDVTLVELRKKNEALENQSKKIREQLSEKDQSITNLQSLLQKARVHVKLLEESVSFQIGQAFVNVIERPFVGIFKLPFRLLKIVFSYMGKKDGKLKLSGPNVKTDFHQKFDIETREYNNAVLVKNKTAEKHSEIRANENKKEEQSITAKDNDLVSVIMTTFNSAEYVSSAIESILNQTYSQLELIIVDDASGDSTFDILMEFAKKDGRVRPFKNFSNRGTYWCKNLGITKAKGAFVTTQDSDDISEKNRIEFQVEKLRRSPAAITCTCNYIRIDDSGNVILNRGLRERIAIMGLMWKKEELTQKIGFFDSVRMAADDEFFQRVKLVFGGNMILHVDFPLYIATYREGSLTTSGPAKTDMSKSNIIGKELSFLSPIRQEYVRSYKIWHESILAGTEKPYMPFPLLKRKFSVPSQLLCDKLSKDEFVTASLASIPSRGKALEQVVERILPQVDHLNVFLNNYEDVPIFLNDKKIKIARSQDYGDQKDNGKFFFLEELSSGYHFTIDDDILYPYDYVQRCILKILQYDKQVIIGIHGVIFPNPIERFYKDREVFSFKFELDRDRFVNLLGTGTIAYHTGTINLNYDDFKDLGMADMWFAIAAKKQKVPLIAIKRPAGLLRQIDVDSSLFHKFKLNDHIQTREIIANNPWDFNSLFLNYKNTADYLLENFTLDELRSRDVDVDFLLNVNKC